MRDSVEKDLGAARGRGRAAVTWFWALTLIDTLRFGLAERFRQSSLPASVAGPQGALMKSLLTTDLRDAWRSLRATPIVTTVAVLSLALGIGANTALFSILNSLVLKSLPVHDPQQLALLAEGDWTNPIGRPCAAAREKSVTAPLPGAPHASTSPSVARPIPWTGPGSAAACSTCSASGQSGAGTSPKPTTSEAVDRQDRS